MDNSNGTTTGKAMTQAEMLAYIEELKAQNAKLEIEKAKAEALAARKGPKVSSMTVGDKGGLSLHGLQKFPVTLYIEQWEAIFEAEDRIKAFITANRSKFSTRS